MISEPLHHIHCCNTMADALEDGNVLLEYDAQRVEYAIFRSQKGKKRDAQVICYCPWCGAHLPHVAKGECCASGDNITRRCE